MDHQGKKRARGAIGAISLTALCAGALAFSSIGAGSAFAADKIIVGLITKTNTNPFFAKMKEGAEAKAKELGVDFRSYAGKYDGDNTGQVDAVELLMNAGAKGDHDHAERHQGDRPVDREGAEGWHPGHRARHASRPAGRRRRDLRYRQRQGGRIDRRVGHQDAGRQSEGRARRLRRRAGRSAERGPGARLRLLEGLRHRKLRLETVRA
jgi:hypothetical protein